MEDAYLTSPITNHELYVFKISTLSYMVQTYLHATGWPSRTNNKPSPVAIQLLLKIRELYQEILGLIVQSIPEEHTKNIANLKIRYGTAVEGIQQFNQGALRENPNNPGSTHVLHAFYTLLPVRHLIDTELQKT